MAFLTSVYNHLVLPPQLPDRPDEDSQAVSSAILDLASQACRNIENMGNLQDEPKEVADVWPKIAQTLKTCQGIDRRNMEAALLLQDWRCFAEHDVFLLYIAEHNAALLLRRTNDK